MKPAAFNSRYRLRGGLAGVVGNRDRCRAAAYGDGDHRAALLRCARSRVDRQDVALGDCLVVHRRCGLQHREMRFRERSLVVGHRRWRVRIEGRNLVPLRPFGHDDRDRLASEQSVIGRRILAQHGVFRHRLAELGVPVFSVRCAAFALAAAACADRFCKLGVVVQRPSAYHQPAVAAPMPTAAR